MESKAAVIANPAVALGADSKLSGDSQGAQRQPGERRRERPPGSSPGPDGPRVTDEREPDDGLDEQPQTD